MMTTQNAVSIPYHPDHQDRYRATRMHQAENDEIGAIDAEGSTETELEVSLETNVELVTPVRESFEMGRAEQQGRQSLGVLSSSSASSSFADGFDPNVLACSVGGGSHSSSSADQTAGPSTFAAHRANIGFSAFPTSARPAPSGLIPPLRSTTATSSSAHIPASKPVLESPFKSPGWRTRQLEKLEMSRQAAESMDEQEGGEEMLDADMELDEEESMDIRGWNVSCGAEKVQGGLGGIEGASGLRGGAGRGDQEVPMRFAPYVVAQQLSKTLSSFSISRPAHSNVMSTANVIRELDIPDSPSPAPIPSTLRVHDSSTLTKLDGQDPAPQKQAGRPAMRLRTSTAPPFLLSMSRSKGFGQAWSGDRMRSSDYMGGPSELSPISPSPMAGASSQLRLSSMGQPLTSASTTSLAVTEVYSTPETHKQIMAPAMQPSESLSPREWERARSKTTPPRWTSRFGAFDTEAGTEGVDPPEWIAGSGLGLGLASPFSSGGPNAKEQGRAVSGHAYGDSFSYAYRSGNGRIGANGYEYGSTTGMGMQYPLQGTSARLDFGRPGQALTSAADDTLDEARERVERWARETYPQISVPELAPEAIADHVETGRGSSQEDRLTPKYGSLYAPGAKPNVLAATGSFGSFVSLDSGSTGSGLALGIAHRGSPSPSPLAPHGHSNLFGSRARGQGMFSPAQKSPLRHQRETSGNSSLTNKSGEDQGIGAFQSQSSPIDLPTRLPLHPSLAQPVFYTQERPRSKKRGGSVKSPDLERGPDSGMMLGYFDGVGLAAADAVVEEHFNIEGTSFEENGTGLIKTARIRSATTPHAARVLLQEEASQPMQGRKSLYHARTRSKTSIAGHRERSRMHSSPPPRMRDSLDLEDVDMIEQLDSPKGPLATGNQADESPMMSRSSSRSRKGKSLSEPTPFAVASAMTSENGSPISRKKSSLPLRLDTGPSVSDEVVSLNSPDISQLGFLPRSPSDPLMNLARPMFLRKFTDPTGARPSTPAGMALTAISDSSGKKTAWRKSFHSGLDRRLASESMSTPIQAFEMERPSPAAFMSTGLVKKGSGYLKHSAASSGAASAPPETGIKRMRSTTLHNDVSRTPDTPVKVNAGKPYKALVVPPVKMKIHPLRLGESAVPILTAGDARRLTFGTAASNPPTDIPLSTSGGDGKFGTGALGIRSRGLRRKGSRMWQRTDSGNYSNGSTVGEGFSLDEEPETPTRPDNAGVVKLDFATHTPSPPMTVHTYPFASVHGETHRTSTLADLADSPSPPKKNTLLSRLQYSGKHRALARISNPLLNAAYKLGEQQSGRKPNVRSSSAKTDKVSGASRNQAPALAMSFERDFTLLEPLGQGEFSTVWRVKDKKDGLMYAVKRNKPFIGEKDRQRQWEEVNIMRLLSVTPNQHVMHFHDAWEEKQQLHIKIGLAECGDLSAYLNSIADAGGLDEGRVWKLLTELTSGLRHVHSFDVLHLDLKPSNILLDRDGSVRIADFGLSTQLSIMSSPAIDRVARSNNGNGASKDSIREGDREYMSPETLHGHFSKAADVYNLGITILEAAMNVVLPSNGDAWQKLRSNDFSDLDEHWRPTTSKIPTERSMNSIGNIPSLASTTYGTSVSSSGSMISLEDGPITSTLLTLIKGMMVSDPLQRCTIGQVWQHAVVERIRVGEVDHVNVRTSTDSQSRSSVDGWENWARQKGCGGLTAWAPPGSRDVKPALVPEDGDFLEMILGM